MLGRAAPPHGGSARDMGVRVAMLKRFYADNFRCLTNFELELDEANVFLGANGTGKTSVLEVLRKIQDLIARGRRVGEAFPLRDLSLGQDRNTQRFGIEACIERQSYRYELTVVALHARGRSS